MTDIMMIIPAFQKLSILHTSIILRIYEIVKTKKLNLYDL